MFNHQETVHFLLFEGANIHTFDLSRRISQVNVASYLMIKTWNVIGLNHVQSPLSSEGSNAGA
jgi:hypothetical protein